MYKNDAFLSNTIDSIKNNLNKITALISLSFIIISILSIANCSSYKEIDLTGLSIPYIIIMDIIIICISLITIYICLKKSNNKIIKINSIILIILLLFSIIVYFSIYAEETKLANEIYQQAEENLKNTSKKNKYFFVEDNMLTPIEKRAKEIKDRGSFPPILSSFYNKSSIRHNDTHELSADNNYYYNFLTIIIAYIFFIQYYIKHINDELEQEKSKILSNYKEG